MHEHVMDASPPILVAIGLRALLGDSLNVFVGHCVQIAKTKSQLKTQFLEAEERRSIGIVNDALHLLHAMKTSGVMASNFLHIH
jgi:hypothetical protein